VKSSDSDPRTGYDLQDALFDAVGDPVAAVLEDLDAEALLLLLSPRVHNIVNIRKFMADHSVPARRPDARAASLLLPRIRRDKGSRRQSMVRWLTLVLSVQVHHALVSAVGTPEARAAHSDVDLDGLIEEYGKSSVQLAVLSGWGSSPGELNLAMLIVDGRAVPERWTSHIDTLRPLASRIVDEFDEAHHDRSFEFDLDEDAAMEMDHEAAEQEAPEDEAAAHAPTKEVDGIVTVTPGPGRSVVARDRDSAPTEAQEEDATVPETSSDEAPGEEPGPLYPFHKAEREAIHAFEAMDSARRRFEDAMEALRRVTPGARERITGATHSAPGAVKDADLEALRRFASSAKDPEDLRFLEALAHLLDLVHGDGGDEELIAAEDALRSFPANVRFRAIVFAAGRGRIRVPSTPKIDTRLAPWIGTKDRASSSPEKGAEVPALVIPSAPEAVEKSPGSDSEEAETPEVFSGDGLSVGVSAKGVSVDSEQGRSPTPLSARPEPSLVEESPSPAALGHDETALRDASSATPVPAYPSQEDGLESEYKEDEDEEEALSEALESAFSRMFATGHWGLARWLAIASGDAARADALEVIAYANGARSASGPLAIAITAVLDALSPQRLGGDRAVQLLAVAAATRAALVAPFSGVNAPLFQLARTFDTDAPAIAAIADAASDAALRGVAFTGDVIASLGGAAETDAKIHAVSSAADAMLRRTGRTGFVRADHIWNEWVSSGGPVNELLEVVAANDTTRAEAVRARVFEYSKESVVTRRLRTSDDHYRGGGKARVEGPARTTLVSRLRDALKLAATWLDLVQARQSSKAEGHETAVATQVRETVSSMREGLMSELDRFASCEELELAGAAKGARRLYETTFSLIEGEPLRAEEAAATELLNLDLLRSPVALRADLSPVDATAVTVDSLIEADLRSWDDSFDARCAVGDHVATGAIASAVTESDPEHGAQLAQRRSEALAEARDQVDTRARNLRARLEAARRAGRLGEDSAAALDAMLATAEAGWRTDIDAVRNELDSVDAALEFDAATAIEAFRERLDGLSNIPAVAGASEQFRRLLGERDLATAEELLLQLQDGVAQPSEHQPDIDFSSFFPSVVEHLADGITTELIETARRQGSAGPLDFRGLSPEAAEAAATALSGWRTVSKGARRVRKTDDLVPALRTLGIEFGNEKPAGGLPGSNDRVWVDLTGVQRIPPTLVPAFGTYAGGTQRLLLVWKQPSESLLEWVEQDPSERPVIVLYFGTLPVEVRRRIANRLRTHPRPVVVVDDAVLAWAVSLGRQSFEATMRVTLPFSAVNPYQPGIAGAVPEEMFFGRVAERSAVISETGTSLIYGGRRLGKSALLRAAERRFANVPGQIAVYIDLSPAGMRSTKRPAAVWDLIAARLVDVGVAQRPSAKRQGASPLQRAEEAIRTYLAAATNRKLLLLLDECDDFFDTDAEGDFSETRRLKDLMESTGRRFKVVFAGLHQVARFASYPNQPLAHLGKPLAIGPLAPQYAYNLIAQPFVALGWRFDSEDLINRVLAYCNYTPILLQEFGQTLISHLHLRRLSEAEPPSVITAADIDAVLSSGSLAEAIRSRFDLTLSLDPRYKMIAYVLAVETQTGGRASASASMSTSDLREECRGWWPDGFSSVNDDEFRALLDELASLGVLASDRGAWRMRSPNVLRLLGTREAIETGLMELVRENPTPGGFFSAEAHRLVETGSDRRVRSPFTEQQFADVIGEGRNQLRVVVGTAATSAGQVGEVLRAARSIMGRWELVVPTKPSFFERAVLDVPARTHRVIFADLREVAEENLQRSLFACAKDPSAPSATRSAVLLVTPASMPVVEGALALIGLEDAAIVSLRRYSPAALRAWAVEVESGFTDDTARRQLETVTGGWPILLAEVEETARPIDVWRALSDLESSVARKPEWWLAVVGLLPGPLTEAWASVSEVLGPEGSEPVDDLGAFVGDEDGYALVRGLVACGVLVEDGGKVHLDARTARAWRLVHGTEVAEGP
jgi:hypothetical protein